jgi:hypothetical protein
MSTRFVHHACLKRTWTPDMTFETFDEHIRKCLPFDDEDK